jgi:hypothetical protein
LKRNKTAFSFGENSPEIVTTPQLASSLQSTHHCIIHSQCLRSILFLLSKLILSGNASGGSRGTRSGDDSDGGRGHHVSAREIVAPTVSLQNHDESNNQTGNQGNEISNDGPILNRKKEQIDNSVSQHFQLAREDTRTRSHMTAIKTIAMIILIIRLEGSANATMTFPRPGKAQQRNYE